ncbi:hypothetical protein BC938DRAFT_473161 [Jimgerdemannia flammicorona]|uniref:DUF1446-domain-containing protein n=1 Tax=Jimgerdemannia flammicorona TaxID=994334 RepID=A0A433QZS1_9FUNG|nr:hypothetical protein BC938DRAFT_473161 [Jimgerdemannia flammicorona]
MQPVDFKSEQPVRIGCYSAFWGDSVAAAEQLVKKEGKNLDYLVADYLAEVTMGLLARRRTSSSKDLGGAGAGGYVAEFITLVLSRLLPDIAKHGIKIVTNAGGLDPLACKDAIESALRDAGIPDGQIIVAAVSGDDLLGETFTRLRSSNQVLGFSGVDHGGVPTSSPLADSLPPDSKPPVSLNAYLGAIPIARALSGGAHIVVTGRVVDSALVLGPLMHEYGWDPSKDFDRLAAGSLAGHIIECGCQATGGNFTDWEASAFSPYGGWSNMGYPVVECFEDGSFVVTKPKGTGGLVTPATVGEQMVYEVLDPGAYLLPDVVLDLRYVKLSQIGKDRVLVTGARGRRPTKLVKCSGVYVDGYKMSGELVVGGMDAYQKSVALGQAIITRSQSMIKRLGMPNFRGINIEPLGAEYIYGPCDARGRVEDHGAPRQQEGSGCVWDGGGAGGGSGRPHPSPNLVHFSCLVPKSAVPARLTIGASETCVVDWEVEGAEGQHVPPPLEPEVGAPQIISGTMTNRVPLIKVAYGRSGDKGDCCNIGIIARNPKYYPYLIQALTEQVVADYMAHLCEGTVKRYELPGSNALNFVLTRSLGGGGLSSLRVDRQGKTYAQMLLSGIMVEIPAEMVAAKL